MTAALFDDKSAHIQAANPGTGLSCNSDEERSS